MAAALPVGLSTSRRLGYKLGDPMPILTLGNSLTFHFRTLVNCNTSLTIAF
jgi:hypothetical protein